MRFLHASDLHLSEAEADYGFSVLEELLGACAGRGAAALVLSGDCFDSYADLKALYPRFRKAVEAAPGVFPVLAISGNHDILRGSGDLERYDFGPRAAFARSAPQRITVDSAEGSCEFILIPYGQDPRSLPPPAEGSDLPRVAVAHGSLPELNWLGPEGEEGETRRSGLDSHSLLGLEPDYVALGHIHEGKSKRVRDVLFAYPGSARVWRRGESGPRTALLVSVRPGSEARCEAVPLLSAGEYRKVHCGLAEDGGLDPDAAEKALEGLGAADWVEIGLIGVAQRELPLRQAMDEFSAGLGKRFRKADVDAEAVAYLGEESDTAAARDFRQAWNAERARLEEAYGREAALRALQVGLSAIARAQEARK